MNIRRGPGRPFEPGNQYGQGRPAGSRNNATIMMEEMLEGDADAIVRKAIELAKTGNETALRLCLDRLIPPRRDRTVRLTLPADLATAEGNSSATASVLNAVAAGEITPGEAVQLANVLEVRRRSIETSELESRIAELERVVKTSKQAVETAEETHESDPQTS